MINKTKAYWLSLCTIGLTLFANAPAAFGGPVMADDHDLYVQATELFQRGQYIEAKEMLLQIDLAELDLAERSGALSLLDQVDEEVEKIPLPELRLQKAKIEIDRHDYRSATSRLKNVTNDPDATDSQKSRATTLLREIEAYQQNLQPYVPKLLNDGITAFEGGDYALAKANLLTIYNSGVHTELDQQVLLLDTVDKIYIAETQQDMSFDVSEDVEASLWALGKTQSYREVTPGESNFSDGGAIHAIDNTTMNMNTTVEMAQDHPQDHPTEHPSENETQAVEEVVEQDTPEHPEHPTETPAMVDESADETVEEVVEEAQDAVVEEETYEPPHDLIYQAQQAQAAEFLQQAMDAQNEGRYETAVSLYNKVLTIQPENEAAIDGRDYCETKLNRGPLPGPEDINLRAQQLKAELENLLEQAESYKAEGNYTQANNMISRAQVRLSDGRSLLRADEYEELRSTILATGEGVIQTRREAERAEAEARLINIEEARITERAELERKRREEITEKLIGIRRLQMAQKYEEALLELKAVLFMDPGNAVTQALHDTIEEVLIYREWDKTERESNMREVKNSIDIQKKGLIPTGLVEYPDDWPLLSTRRLGGLAYLDSEADRSVRNALASKRVNIDYQENELGSVLGHIASLADINMDVEWRALENNFIDRHTKVNLKLNDQVSLQTVLDRVLRQVGEDEESRPHYAITDGILTISTLERLQSNPESHVYDIHDLLINIPNFKAPDMGIDAILEGGNRTNNMSNRLFGEQQDEEHYDANRMTREERINKIRNIITTTIDKRSWEVNGGDVGIIQELNGNLIIVTTPRNHRDISNLLGKLREIRSLQINVESRFLLVAEDFFEQIGFDLDIWWGGTPWDTQSQEDPNLLMSDMFHNKETDQYTPWVQRQYFSLYELRGQTDAAGNPTFDGNGRQGIEGVLPEAGFQQLGRHTFNPWSLQQNTLEMTESLFGAEATSFAGRALNMTPGLTYAISYLDEIQVDLLIKATQADRRSVQLTAPRITFFNGQRAFVQLTTTQFFVSDLEPMVGDASAGFNPQLQAVQDGVVLDVEGTVAADRRYVTMTVIVSRNAVIGIEETEVPLLVGGIIVQSGEPSELVQVPGVVQRPIVQTSQVNTTVSVPDRGTILLGGQTVRNEIEMESGVPVLSKIPIINRFFTNRLSSVEEQTLLILLKPTIIIQQENEEMQFPGLQDTLGGGNGNYGGIY